MILPVVVMEYAVKVHQLSIHQYLCLLPHDEFDHALAAVLQPGVLLLNAQPVHEDLGRRRGLPVAYPVCALLDEVHHHACELRVLVEVPQVRGGLPLLTLLLLQLVFLLHVSHVRESWEDMCVYII